MLAQRPPGVVVSDPLSVLQRSGPLEIIQIDEDKRIRFGALGRISGFHYKVDRLLWLAEKHGGHRQRLPACGASQVMVKRRTKTNQDRCA